MAQLVGHRVVPEQLVVGLLGIAGFLIPLHADHLRSPRG